jgi:hypothetical protein
MSRRFWTAAILAAVLLGAVGCTVGKRRWQPNASAANAKNERIVGITARDGDVKTFDRDPAAKIDGETLHASIKRKPFQIAVSDVQRYWVETRHVSAARTVGLVAGIAMAAAATVAVVAVSEMNRGSVVVLPPGTGCCLFVYSWDGRQYSFDSEAYTAAITRGLERDDYSVLPQLREQDGQYRLMISNDMDETQYTDLLELWVVDHDRGVQPRAGDNGTVHGVTAPLPPLTARDGEGNDLRDWLDKRDQLIWEPEPAPDRNGSLRREIVLTFPKPPGAREAKLVASATYTLWSGYMAGQMLQLQGRDLPAWYREIDEQPAPRDRLLNWMASDELYALHVEVEETDGWHTRAVLPVAGPFTSDERVATLDVSRASGGELRIRLRPPAGFWAFNSFAIDYGPEAPLSVTRIPLQTAHDERGADLLPALTAADDRYYEMDTVGERAFVTFPAPALQPGRDRTLFLHSRGYYRMHVPEGGEPNHAAFETILTEPGAGARLSAQAYAALKQAQAAPVR